MNKILALAFHQKSLLLLPLVLIGCGTQKKPEVIHERGWIGGQVEFVKVFPKELAPKPKAGILVTALFTNTPAAKAGLHEGDVILSLKHAPIKRLKDFRKSIDALKPGADVTLTAYRDGKTTDYNVKVGREKYRQSGSISIFLPLYNYGSWNLWPTAEDPGISLIALGYDLGKGHRKELHSVKSEYLRKTGSKAQPYEEDFKVWVAFLNLSKGKNVVSQETVDAPQ